MPVLTNPRWEQFAALVAAGATHKEAYTSAGYRAPNANKSSSRLAKQEQIRARIDELCHLAAHSRAQMEWLNRAFVLDGLKRVVDKAFELEKLADAVAALRLLGMEVDGGMFRDKHDHTLKWDGNPASLTEAQQATLIAQLEALVFQGDAAEIAAARREALQLGPGVVDVTGEAVQ